MENIHVNIRIKPSITEESFFKYDYCSIINSKTNEKLTFDKIIQEYETNQNLFDSSISQLIHDALKGINVTVLAYGQTSTGKTYTMRGTEEDSGIIPRVLNYLLLENEMSNIEVSVSYYEIYNEIVNDLIEPKRINLEIRENPHKGVFVENLSKVTVASYSEAINLLYKGDSNKKIAETKSNDKSSRSHTIFNIEIKSDKYKGSINLVDLAGSENVTKANTQGIRLKEGSNINKSLLSLSNVISKLSQNQKQFINYRDSKLTRILQNSINGNSKTLIICTINTSPSSYFESWNTLSFGSRAKCIKTTVKVNAIDEKVKIAKENSELKSKVKELESILSKTATKSPLKGTIRIDPDANNDTNIKLSSLVSEFNQLKQIILNNNNNNNNHSSYLNNTAAAKNDFSLLSSFRNTDCQVNLNQSFTKMSDSAKKISDEYPRNLNKPFSIGAGYGGNISNQFIKQPYHPMSNFSSTQNKYSYSSIPSMYNPQQDEYELHKQIKHKDAYIKELEFNFHSVKEDNERILKESNELNKRLHMFDKEFNELASVNDKLEKLKNEKLTVESQISLLRKSYDHLVSENKILKGDCESYKQENSLLKDKINRIKNERKNDSGSSKDDTAKELQELNIRTSQLLDENHKYKTENESLYKENKELQSLIDELFDKMSEMEKLINTTPNPADKKPATATETQNHIYQTISENKKENGSIFPKNTQFTVVSDFSFNDKPVVDSNHKNELKQDQTTQPTSEYKKTSKQSTDESRKYKDKDEVKDQLLNKKRLSEMNLKKNKFDAVLKSIKPSSFTAMSSSLKKQLK